MKKKYSNTLYLAITIFAMVIFYLNSPYYIEKQFWKYNNGKHIGDVINNIKQIDNSKCQIVFCFGKKLIIEDLKTGENGYYENKNW
ncbi:hypothetical protein C3L50_00880 [Flavobacterium alvei]|uniref:Uncharacterized protein n=1 Tax=Flavobacterium alvei TaxID=2080416 RepID=A0A2S5AEV9_9FLAO|nr:hypothetical protein [Flavobacterium alvei]POY41114.1 hypothetical protein C3L50_00880 [Flavobacterium alvei]